MTDQTEGNLSVPKPLEEMTVKELQAELILKFNFVGAEVFTSRAQLIAVYNNLQKKMIDQPKNTAEPVIDNARQDEKHYESKAAKMKALCDKEPKVRFMIPLGIGEKPGAIETAQINGYRLNILKGVMVSIPERFAKLLEESYKMTAEAGQDLLVDRDENVKSRLE